MCYAGRTNKMKTIYHRFGKAEAIGDFENAFFFFGVMAMRV